MEKKKEKEREAIKEATSVSGVEVCGRKETVGRREEPEAASMNQG